MADDFDDILGVEEADDEPEFMKRKPGRPSREVVHQRQQYIAEMNAVDNGAPIDWFVKNFHMNRTTVMERLRKAPVHRRHPRTKHPYYLVNVAAAYLVDPLRDRSDFLDNIKAADLPEKLRESFWNAKIKELKFKVLAGELWPTESVMEVLADTFQLISGKTKLWVDDLEEVSQLSDEQRRYLARMVDDLIGEIRKSLIERAESKVTESYVAEMDS
jgi:hypothetical protein